jgi:hypothetical protein
MTFVPRNAQTRRLWTTLLSLAPLCGVLFFQNCGKGFSPNPASSYISPRSPFYDARVRFDEPQAKATDNLTLLIHNGCAAERCPHSTVKGIACTHCKESAKEKLKDQLQAYDWTPGRERNAQELENLISQNSEDNACIAGVSHTQKYKIEAVAMNDAYKGMQYYHETIKTGEALDFFSSQPIERVRVGIIDTGVDMTHEDLRYRGGPNFNYSEECSTICNPHGTFVAGIIMAQINNLLGGYGLAQAAAAAGSPALTTPVDLYSFQIGDANGNMQTSEIVNAIAMAKIYGVEVLNLSLGGSDTLDFSYQNAMVSAMDGGMVIVVAAGNSDANLEKYPTYPASFNYDGQINVGSASPEAVSDTADPPYNVTNSPIKRDFYSNYGRSVVHLAAPGRRVFSTTPGNGYAVASGTSFSAPMVTAAVALTKGFLKKKGISASTSLVKQLVLQGTRPESGLTESIGGMNTESIAGNRFLDLSKLKTALADFAAIVAANPTRIELISSEVIGPAGAQSVRVRIRVSEADLTRGMRLRAYTNRQFLTDSYTGLECSITTTPAFCDFDISYTKLLIDPEVYFQAVDNTGTVFSDFTIPKAALNFGIRADSRLAGEIVGVTHNGRAIKVEGWACLIGFPDKVKIEVRAYSNTGAPFATLKTSQQARGNYYTTCNSAEISMGFEYVIPNYMYSTGAAVPFFFRAVHEETGKTLDLKVYKYQPGYQDTRPAEYADSVYVDPAISDVTPQVTITKREFKDWVLTIEGSACYRSSRKPASFTVGLFQDEILSLYPKIWDENGVALSDAKASVAAFAASGTGKSWSISNPNPRSIDRAGYGMKVLPMFSEIHYPFPFTDAAGSKNFLATDGDYMTTYGVQTINPSIERGDGCAMPSGFSAAIDIRPYISNTNVYFSVYYNTGFYASYADVLKANGGSQYLKIANDPAPKFSELRFKSRAFKTALLFQQGWSEIDLFSDMRSFANEIYRIPAGAPRFLTRNEVNGQVSRHDVRNPIYSAAGSMVGVEDGGGVVQTYFETADGVGGQFRSDSKTWGGDVDVQLTKSNAVALSVVYQSGPLTLAQPKSTHLMISLWLDGGTAFGELGKDFVVDFLDPSTGGWYELPVDQYQNMGIGSQILTADVDHVRALDQTQIRIRANGKNQFRIHKIGFLTE